MPAPQTERGRLAYLDGLRAFAVIWVMLFHYLHFWSSAGGGVDLVAFDAAFRTVPFVSVGFLGVHLFFIISGFVILLTLEKSRGFGDFMLRRMTRLWPPLLLFGTITFLVVNAIGPVELRASPSEYLISMFFLPPNHVGLLVGQTGWSWLDGAYWSLYVEIKFYLVIGTLFFLFRQSYLWIWLAVEALMFALWVANIWIGSVALDLLDGFLFQQYMPYFTFGLVGYRYYSGRGDAPTAAVALFALAHLVTIRVEWALNAQAASSHILEALAGETFVVLVVWLYLWRGWRIPGVASGPMTAVGRGSYGMYLLHQNVGVAILALPLFAPPLLGALGVAAVTAVMAAAAQLSFHHFEQPLQAALRQRLSARRI